MSGKFKNMFAAVTKNNNKSNVIVDSTPYPNKPLENINFDIPNNIFQTWQTKILPPKMFDAISKIKRQNPRFNYFLFDDSDCREFIKTNFPVDVLNAYDSLIPGAYKADLWRYCILYKMGGIYLDIKYEPINGFKFYNLLEKEHWVQDVTEANVYNALMVCKAGNPILLKAIIQICENVKNKYYGEGFLHPTGPALLANYFTSEEKNAFDIKHRLYGINDGDKYIKFNDRLILKCYSGYFSERENSSTKKHYADFWHSRQVYL